MILREHFKANGKPKRAFPSHEAAARHLLALNNRRFLIYHCSFCNQWHLASTKGQTARQGW